MDTADTMEKKRKFTVAEAAAVLDVNKRTVYRMIERGDLDALKPGQSYVITRTHLRDYAGGEEALADLEAEADE
jgi:excisionase family DNA binding protein